MARFTKGQCQPCPFRTRCTTSRKGARNVGFPPRELRDLQIRVRAEQQTPDWRARYAVRSGWRAPSTSSPMGTAPAAAAAAAGDSRRPTCSTSSRPSP
ncbi:transposase [Streptomyces sp. ISL-44]|uniref:transposase n=1 Tax=Streptomyces sp. ISL-44 TaxID=2819184 RepID=UPI0027E2A85F|nr:transposase [Streptomyces sp. ISL-44]